MLRSPVRDQRNNRGYLLCIALSVGLLLLLSLNGKQDTFEPVHEGFLVKTSTKNVGRNAKVQTEFCKSFEPLPPRIGGRLEETLPKLTYKQMMALPSKYTLGNNKFDYTVVIGAWRRPNTIERILKAFEEQTHPPTEIWISIFASPKEAEYKQVLPNYAKTSRIPIKVIYGEPQLSYWARFQLALQIKTPYALMLDDDSIPGKKWAASILHMMNTDNYRGVYGFKGHIRDSWILHPEQIHFGDVVGGSWFVETSWVKVLFREKPYTWLTGEDWHLCYQLRKYFNLATWIAPHDPKDPDTHAISSDYMKISESGDTTFYIKDDRVAKREELIQFQYRRGYAHVDVNPKQTAVAIVATSPQEATRLKGVYDALIQQQVKQTKDQEYHWSTVVITGGQQLGDQKQIMYTLGGSERKLSDTTWFDMMIGEEAHREKIRLADIAAEAMYAAQQILEASKTQVVIGVIDDNPALMGVVHAANSLNIPFVAISAKEGGLTSTLVAQMLSVASRRTCTTEQCTAESALAILDNHCKWS